MRKNALISLACALSLTACADAHDKLAHSEHNHAGQAATVKPGGNIGLSHEFVVNPIVGGAQIVRVTIEEPYTAGALDIKVVKNEGIRILQSTGTSINLAAGDSHTWDLQFEAPEEGRFYIGIIATVQGERKSPAYRAYSIPVYVGDVTDYKREAKGFSLEKTPDTQPIVTMEAQETIKQDPPTGN